MFDETTVVPRVNGRGRRVGLLFDLMTPPVEPALSRVLIAVFLILITALPDGVFVESVCVSGSR